MSDTKAMNFNDLLSKTAEQIDDAPEFIQLPDGSHLLKIEEIKQVPGDKDKNAQVKFKYTYLQNLEMVNPSDTVPAEKSIAMENFQLTEEGLPYLKRHVKDVWAGMPGTSLGEVLKALEGQTVAITSKTRISKKDGKEYKNWNSVAMTLAT